MKCLDQNGVKHLWNLIKNKTVLKANVDLSANVNSLNPISNNAVCNHVDSIADSLRNSKADYEEGTWTPVFWKGMLEEQINAQYLEDSWYFRVGEWVYITTSVICRATPESVSGLPFSIEGAHTPAYTDSFTLHGSNRSNIHTCVTLSSSTNITFMGNTMTDFTLCGWAKIKR